MLNIQRLKSQSSNSLSSANHSLIDVHDHYEKPMKSIPNQCAQSTENDVIQPQHQETKDKVKDKMPPLSTSPENSLCK